MDEKDSNSILVPAPTAWPIITALGIALIFTGLVTHPAVSILGAVILLRSAVGWWFDVLPEQKEEPVPVSPAEEVSISRAEVAHLAVGRRAQVPAEVHPYWT